LNSVPIKHLSQIRGPLHSSQSSLTLEEFILTSI
jgi:hypothetical protein